MVVVEEKDKRTHKGLGTVIVNKADDEIREQRKGTLHLNKLILKGLLGLTGLVLYEVSAS